MMQTLSSTLKSWLKSKTIADYSHLMSTTLSSFATYVPKPTTSAIKCIIPYLMFAKLHWFLKKMIPNLVLKHTL